MISQAIKERDCLNGAGIAPISINGTLTNTGTIDMSVFNRVNFYVYQGVGAFNINAALQQGNNSSGNDAVALGTPSFVNLNAAGNYATIEMRADQMTARYIRCQVNTAGAVLVSVVGIGTECRYGPANSFDSANFVTQANRVVT